MNDLALRSGSGSVYLRAHPRLPIYIWLYLAEISKLRGIPMEAAMTTWLSASYFHAGESPAFLHRTNLALFQCLFGSRAWGTVALVRFAAGVLWLLGDGLLRKRRDIAAFGLLLLLPVAFGMAGPLLGFYRTGAPGILFIDSFLPPWGSVF
jgi:hypothetical protein